MKNILWLSLFLVLSLVIRVIFLSHFPPSLNWDEASLGYNAFSLLKTGHDEWGIALPSIFRAFGDYKLPGYVYFSVLPTAILGLNSPSTRISSVIFGIVLVLSTFLLAGKKSSLWAALIATFSPWSWFLSRIALEANVAAGIFSLGMVLYFTSFSSILTTLFLTLPVWVYNSYRVFVPLILIPLWIINRKRISLITALVILLPMFSQMFLASGQARYKWVSIIDSGAIGQIIDLRNSSKFIYPNLFYNRYTFFVFQFSKNYINHFSPQFLFTSGSTNYQFNIPNQGLIYLIFAPFFYWGIFELFKERNQKTAQILLSWLLIAPIASSITKDSPHVLRSITFLPLPFILIAHQLSKIKTKLLLLLLSLVFLVSGINYFNSLIEYSSKYSWSWQYGYSQLVSYVSQHQGSFDQVIITKKYGEPHIFFLYYQKINPFTYRFDANLDRYFRSDWYWVDSFSKYRFVNDWEFSKITAQLNPDLKYLLVSSQPISATHLTDIKFLDNKIAFYIYEK